MQVSLALARPVPPEVMRELVNGASGANPQAVVQGDEGTPSEGEAQAQAKGARARRG